MQDRPTPIIARAFAWIVALALVVRAAAGLPDLWRRAVGGERPGALAALAMSDAERIELALGEDVDLLRALDRATGDGDQVFVLVADLLTHMNRVLDLQVLLYPLRMRELARLPTSAELREAGDGRFLLLFEAPLPEGVFVVETGRDWTLVRADP